MVQLIVVVLSCQYFLVTVNEEKNIYGQGSHSDWKTWKMGRHFPVREKSGNFEQTGKLRENHTKYWKTQGI